MDRWGGYALGGVLLLVALFFGYCGTAWWHHTEYDPIALGSGYKPMEQVGPCWQAAIIGYTVSFVVSALLPAILGGIFIKCQYDENVKADKRGARGRRRRSGRVEPPPPKFHGRD